MEKFVEFQPYIIKLSSFIVFELFINFSVIFACAKMRQPLCVVGQILVISVALAKCDSLF